VNLDGVKLARTIEKFMADLIPCFTTVFDELVGLEYKIADAYGVYGTPTLYVINTAGRIAFSVVGRVDQEKLKETIRQSSVQGM
jgi:protein-disulfide isomerase